MNANSSNHVPVYIHTSQLPKNLLADISSSSNSSSNNTTYEWVRGTILSVSVNTNTNTNSGSISDEKVYVIELMSRGRGRDSGRRHAFEVRIQAGDDESSCILRANLEENELEEDLIHLTHLVSLC